MDKTYQPREIETKIYQSWLEQNAFKTVTHLAQKPYCIMLPPPNVTGSLHMGHAFQQTLMDILIRTHRMQGDNVLWQVGVDHAGIATQMVVENQLFKENKTRYDLGREVFVARVWDWKTESGGTIMQQMRRLGASCDWSRERFTMDQGLSQAVQTAFIRLYEDGLIYRGKRLVNWDPHFKTAVSDLEVVHSEEQGFLYHIRYPLVGSSESLVIATTRPETLLGDMAIAVHPEDERYTHLIGQQVHLPLCDRTIPIIADEYVDREFGTGCVKITPAHDFNDYEVGQRHHLEMRCIFTLDGQVNENAPQAYQGLERFTARKKIVQYLETHGFLADKKPHTLNVPRNERGNTVLEPMLTDQWYVKMAPLAAAALDAVKTGETAFVPADWQNTYFRWLEQIQDWCISRQLWWGHRIPAWHDAAGNIYVGESEVTIRQKYQLDESVMLKQDEDVLDTWFSSALWPFSTLGWPDKTPELEYFYPTMTLVTGFDIIFFWVARMIMFGLYFTKQVPFKTVYIHGLIRDHEGQKMSKSKGNVLDPVDLIDGIDLSSLINKRSSGMMQESLKAKVIKATEKQFPNGIPAFGTDALRFTFSAIASPSRDINFDVKRLEGYRNFCNKLWNAARFILLHIEGLDTVEPVMDQGELEQTRRGDLSTSENIHHYFASRLDQTINAVHEALATYRFDLMAQTLYDFFWNDYCDWYLEFGKVILNDPAFSTQEKAHTRYCLLAMLEKILRLLHPIIPFITEAIWQTLKKPLGIHAESIVHQHYPLPIKMSETRNWRFTEWLQALIMQIRAIRSERNIHPGKLLPLYFEGTPDFETDMAFVYLNALAKIERIAPVHPSLLASAQSFILNANQGTCTFYVGDVIDQQAEKARIVKLLAKIDEDRAKIQAKLDNPDFTAKAPAAVIEKERQRLADFEAQKNLLHKDLSFLKAD